MDAYKHEPIDLSKRAIRLLRLLRGDREDPIQCELFQSFFEEDEQVHVEYEALSYTWSDSLKEMDEPGEAPKPKAVYIDGLHFHITTNLHMALKHLRLENSDRIIWVDAICIDQDTVYEKNHQVSQMDAVYRRAENVIVWLGPGSEPLSWILRACEKLWKQVVLQCTVEGQAPLERWWLAWSNSFMRATHGHLGQGDFREAFEALLRRPWFRRVWVIQEVALAKKATVVCGETSAPSSAFSLMPTLLGISVPERAQALLEVMPGPLRDSKYSWWTERRDLATMLQKFGSSTASRPHDRIYALLGISSDSQAIVPNYQEAETVLVQNVLALFVFGSQTVPSDVNWPMWSIEELILKSRPGGEFDGDSIDQRLILWAIANSEMNLAGHLLDRQSRFTIPTRRSGEAQSILHLLAATPNTQDLVKSFTNRHLLSLNFNYMCPALDEPPRHSLFPYNDTAQHSLDFEAPENSELTSETPYETALQCAIRNDNHSVACSLIEAQDLAISRLEALSTGESHGSDFDRLFRNEDRSAVASHHRNLEPGYSAEHAKPFALGRVKRDNSMALKTAVVWRRVDMVALLLQQNANLNDALVAAVKLGYCDIVGILIGHGANIRAATIDGCTPLCFAARSRDHRMVHLLLEHDPAVCPHLREITQHLPSITLLGPLARVKTENLVKLGADRALVEQWPMPRLWCAVVRADYSAVMSTLAASGRGLDIDARPFPFFTTPLWEAANLAGDDATIILRALIEKGADINARDDSNATPLWAAARRGNTEAVRALLKAGADVTIQATYCRDPRRSEKSENTTPLQVAEACGHRQVVNLILERESPLFQALHITQSKAPSNSCEFYGNNAIHAN